MNVIELLKETQGDMTQEAFAALLGIDQSSLSRIYNGERRPGLSVLRGFMASFPEKRAIAVSSFFAGEYDLSQDERRERMEERL